MLHSLVDTCTKCDPTCLTCVNGTLCTSCSYGILRHFKCVVSCLDTEYFSDLEGMCKSCDSACFSCHNNRSNCSSCRDPIQYMFNTTTGECVLRCKAGYYAQPNNISAYNIRDYTAGYSNCSNCSSGCSYCRNVSYCVKCFINYTNQ
jgi:proprotein convertase subtilisin/kexin type 5